MFAVIQTYMYMYVGYIHWWQNCNMLSFISTSCWEGWIWPNWYHFWSKYLDYCYWYWGTQQIWSDILGSYGSNKGEYHTYVPIYMLAFTLFICIILISPSTYVSMPSAILSTHGLGTWCIKTLMELKIELGVLHICARVYGLSFLEIPLPTP